MKYVIVVWEFGGAKKVHTAIGPFFSKEAADTYRIPFMAPEDQNEYAEIVELREPGK